MLTDAEIRRDAYGALRWALLPTHPLAWEVVRSPMWLERLGAALDAAGLGTALPHAEAARAATASFEDADAWQGAYQDVFGRAVRVSPYETDYTASHAFMQSRELADITGFYGAFGVTLAGERADHIGAELEFLYVLAHREAKLARDGDAEGAEVCRDAMRKFVEAHTGRFAAALHDEAQRKGAHPALLHALALARALVERDVASFGLQPAPLPPARALAAAEPDQPECGACPRATADGGDA